MPSGCKDLMDVLQLPKKGDKSHVGDECAILPERIETAGLAHVPRYIAKLCESKGRHTILRITSLDAAIRVVLYRSPAEFSIYPLMGIADEERAVEKFFARRGIQRSASLLIGHPGMATLVLAYPLPTDRLRIVVLIAELLRLVFALDDAAGLEFTYVETEAA